MINLTEKEKTIADQIFELKKQAGTHSPSVFTLKQKISNLEIIIVDDSIDNKVKYTIN